MQTHWADRILRVLDHVHAHLDEELTPEQLSDLAGFSLHHFHRVFRGMVGESVMGYVRRLRLERAAFRLKHAGGDVTSVAFAHGYESHEAFTRAFRAHFGLPPSAYRDREREHERVIEATIRDEAPRRLLTTTHVGPYEQVGAVWGNLVGVVAGLGLPALGPTVGLVHDDPEITPPEKCRYEAGWLIAATARVEPPPGFAIRELPGGPHAVALHRGPFANILDTYVALLGRFLPRRGVEVARDPVLEIYLDAPGSVPEAELRTEVVVRLA